MKIWEVIRLLEDAGWLQGATCGSHRQFKHPTKPGRVTVSRSLGDEMPKGAFASVPALPGCMATGRTIDVALRRIQGAIGLHLRGMREDGLKPPRPQQRSVVPRKTARTVDFYATVEVAA